MIPKLKIEIPKLNAELLKNNFLVIIVAVVVLVSILDIIVWRVGHGAANQARALREKKEQIEEASKRIDKFAKEKTYLRLEEFQRKIPFGAIPPIAAMQQAGLIISEVDADGEVTIAEENTGGSSSSADASADDKDLISVGSKTLKEVKFSFKFAATYQDFIRILEKLAVAEPLITVKGFKIKRIDSDNQKGEPIEGTPFFTIPSVEGDLRKLEVELQLSSFAEISPDEGIWTIE